MFQQEVIARISEQFPKRKFRIAFPEDLDPRVHEALQKLILAGLVEEVFLFSPEADFFRTCSPQLKSLLLEQDCSYNNVAENFPGIGKEIFLSLKQRLVAKGRCVDKSAVRDKAQHPLYKSLCLLSQEKVDIVVAGCCYTTKEVIRAGLDLLGIRKGATTINSSTLLIREAESKFRALYADCGVIMNPSSKELVDIAESTLHSWQKYSFLFPGEQPCVAFLSFASHNSAFDRSVVKVSQAREMFAMRNPGVLVEGPLQFDAAFDLQVRSEKLKVNALGNQRVNIYIFPDLNSGNIAYKITQRLASCESYGPLLQGFSSPFSDLSRGATADDIVMAACLKILELNP